MSRKPRGRKRGHKTRPAPVRASENVVITKIAQQGDGEALLADGTRVFVPLTLPGDEISVQPGGKRGDGLTGSVLEYQKQQPRSEPICGVYGKCGGCQLQHLPAEDYTAWKIQYVKTALSRHGFDLELRPLRQMQIASRRRATLALVMTQDGPVLGYNEAYADRIVGMDGCPLLVEPLAKLWAPLRELAKVILPTPSRADIAMTAANEDALEIVIISDAELDLEKRETLAQFAETHDIARLAWQRSRQSPEPISARRDVVLNFGDVQIALPIGGFLQPSRVGQETLQELVSDGVGDARRVADLYCGVGTFTFHFARMGKHVLAVDDHADQIVALNRAAGRHDLGGRIETKVRDLKESPIFSTDLVGLDAVIFDPPRAGARGQAEYLADSVVPKIIAVSCNPATLARDLRILVDGGYTIDHITPVDQFPMTYHVEAVAVLSRSS